MFRLGLAVGLVPLFVVPARADLAPRQPGSRVLVLPFVAEVEPGAPGGAGAALWLGEAAALLIADGLAAHGVGTLPREERVLAFDRLQLPMPAVLTRATMMRVGEIIGATEVVFGEVSLGETLEVRARTIQLGLGRRLTDVTDRAPLEDIFTLFGRVADRVAAGVMPSAPGSAPGHPPLPLDVFEHYVKGLVAATPAAQRRFLELALSGAPHDARILTALWEAYTAEGDHERAAAAASAVPDEAPGARRARFLLALSLIDLRRFDGAAQTLSRLSDARPAPAIANALGVVELRRSPAAPAAAVSSFRQAADSEPGNRDYVFNLGYAHALAGEVDEALFWLRETVRLDAANGDAHALMAVLLDSQRREAEARRERELARLLGADVPESSDPNTLAAAGLERLDMALDAPAVARAEAAIVDPAQRDQVAAAAFHLEQARGLLARQRDREAADELRRAIYLSPYADEPHRLLGGIYRRAGRLEEAMDELKVAIWSRETAEARIALAEALLEVGDRQGARREAERALVLAPDSAEARALLARAGGGGPPDATTRVLPSVESP